MSHKAVDLSFPRKKSLSNEPITEEGEECLWGSYKNGHIPVKSDKLKESFKSIKTSAAPSSTCTLSNPSTPTTSTTDCTLFQSSSPSPNTSPKTRSSSYSHNPAPQLCSAISVGKMVSQQLVNRHQSAVIELQRPLNNHHVRNSSTSAVIAAHKPKNSHQRQQSACFLHELLDLNPQVTNVSQDYKFPLNTEKNSGEKAPNALQEFSLPSFGDKLDELDASLENVKIQQENQNALLPPSSQLDDSRFKNSYKDGSKITTTDIGAKVNDPEKSNAPRTKVLSAEKRERYDSIFRDHDIPAVKPVFEPLGKQELSDLVTSVRDLSKNLSKYSLY